ETARNGREGSTLTAAEAARRYCPDPRAPGPTVGFGPIAADPGAASAESGPTVARGIGPAADTDPAAGAAPGRGSSRDTARGTDPAAGNLRGAGPGTAVAADSWPQAARHPVCGGPA